MNNGFSFIILRDIHYRFTIGRGSFIYSYISYANNGLIRRLKHGTWGEHHTRGPYVKGLSAYAYMMEMTLENVNSGHVRMSRKSHLLLRIIRACKQSIYRF